MDSFSKKSRPQSSFREMRRFRSARGRRKVDLQNPASYILTFDHVSRSLFLYLPESRHWQQKQKLREEMLQHHYSVIGMDNYVLMWNKTTYRLKLSNKKSMWERMPDMEHGHGTKPPVVITEDSSSLFVVGASEWYEASSAGEEFDTTVRKWKSLPTRNSKLRGNALASVSDSLFCIEGCNKQNKVKGTVKRYVLGQQKWTEVASMIYPRYASTAVTRNHKIYVVGGRCNARILTDMMECYDSLTNTWTDILTSSLEFHFVACVLNEMIFAVETEARVLRKFDDESNEWKEVESLSDLDIKNLAAIGNNSWIFTKNQVIKQEGGTLELPGTDINFPAGSFSESEVNVSGVVNYDVSSCPKSHFAITPILDLHFDSKLQKPVTVKFDNCCTESQHSDIPVTIFHQANDAEEWEIEKTVSLTRLITEFHTQEFSSVLVAIAKIFYDRLFKTKICFYLCAKGNNFRLFMSTQKCRKDKICENGYEYVQDIDDSSKITKKLHLSLEVDKAGFSFDDSERNRTYPVIGLSKPKRRDFILKTNDKSPHEKMSFDISIVYKFMGESKVTGPIIRKVNYEWTNPDIKSTYSRSVIVATPSDTPSGIVDATDQERLEDVFQKEIIKAFSKMFEFKKFARSKDGLKHEDCEVETICQDNKDSVDEQKMGLLRKWKEKMGKDATPERIREIVENYRKKLNKED